MNNQSWKVICLILILPVLALCTHAVDLKKGPYLIYPGDNTQMTVLYQLDGTAPCTLEWGMDTQYKSGKIATSEYGKDHQHKAVISKLNPGSKYFYRVTTGKKSYTGSFRSAPPDSAKNVKFLAYGDTRTYPADHDAVASRMIETFTNDPEFQTFTLHVGDWVQDGDDEKDWSEQIFGRNYTHILKMMNNLPIQGCIGNHEGDGKLYEKYFPYPYKRGGRYWSFDYGPAHITVIDQYTKYKPGTRQYRWIKNDLERTKKEWKFLLFHDPGWSAGTHKNEEDVQKYLQPLCKKYNVRVVFNGHNHYYSHCLVDGVHHLTVGGGGAPLYDTDPGSEHLVKASKSHHFGEITIQGKELTFIARDRDGKVIDSFKEKL